MSKKLKIIGPYTPDHEGPFCTRDGLAARIICRDRFGDYPIVALVSERGHGETIRMYSALGRFDLHKVSDRDLMNAREVPVAREWYLFFGGIFDTKEEAIQRAGGDFSSIIHVREVLPGEGE